jgi:hypothetical protein
MDPSRVVCGQLASPGEIWSTVTPVPVRIDERASAPQIRPLVRRLYASRFHAGDPHSLWSWLNGPAALISCTYGTCLLKLASRSVLPASSVPISLKPSAEFA